MEKEQFYKEVADIFEVEDSSEITENYKLNVAEWGSLQVISMISIIDELYDVTLLPDDFSPCKTLKDVETLISENK